MGKNSQGRLGDPAWVCYASLVYFGIAAMYSLVANVGLVICVMITVAVLIERQKRERRDVKEIDELRAEIAAFKRQCATIETEIGSVRSALSLRNALADVRQK